MRQFFEEMRRKHHEFHRNHGHHGHHMIGRGGHRGGPFGGRGHGGDDESELGGRDFRGGRKLSSSDLQLIILALLEESPRHGYEVIKALDERTNGFYAPSPGMVYPALTYLEELGHATVEQEGSKKRYSITDEAARIWMPTAISSKPSWAS